jgi:hypothetical protein
MPLRLTTFQAYALASLLLFLLHLPLLLVVEGEFTDGVLQAVYFDDPLYVRAEGAPSARYVPPLYPGCLWLAAKAGVPPLTAGRLVSMAAYAVTAFLLARIGHRVGRQSRVATGWLTWTFWALSPMANRWSFHAMSDMLFCCLATASLACYLLSSRGGREQTRLSCWLAGNVLGCASLWTRFQGLALLGAALASWWMGPRRWWNGLLMAAAAWGLSMILLKQGFGIHSEQFAERSVYDWALYLSFAKAAFQYLPYAVTPPLLLLAIYGMYAMSRTVGLVQIWIVLGLVAGVIGLVVQTWFLSFQFRYGLPLLPWLCLLAAIGTSRLSARTAKAAAVATCLWLAGMTGAVLVCQHETFADIERASRRVPDLITPGQTLWACEEYNPHYRNVKVSVWSGLRAKWLDESALDQIKPGDLILDSNVYPISPELFQRIREKWKTLNAAEAASETVPLFPGEILLFPVGPPWAQGMARATSQPELMAYKFIRQYYSTTVYRIVDKSEKN